MVPSLCSRPSWMGGSCSEITLWLVGCCFAFLGGTASPIETFLSIAQGTSILSERFLGGFWASGYVNFFSVAPSEYLNLTSTGVACLPSVGGIVFFRSGVQALSVSAQVTKTWKKTIMQPSEP